MKEYQAAEYLNLGRMTLTRYRYRRRGPEFYIKDGEAHYDQDALDTWSLQRAANNARSGRKPEKIDKARIQTSIRVEILDRMQVAAKRLGLSEGAYIERLIEGDK